MKREEDRVTCRICGREYRWITPGHLKKVHGITTGEYREMFPGVSMMSRETFLKASEVAKARIPYVRTEKHRKMMSDIFLGKSFVDRFGGDRAREIEEKLRGYRKGKTYEEIFGEEKATVMREEKSITSKRLASTGKGREDRIKSLEKGREERRRNPEKHKSWRDAIGRSNSKAYSDPVRRQRARDWRASEPPKTQWRRNKSLRRVAKDPEVLRRRALGRKMFMETPEGLEFIKSMSDRSTRLMKDPNSEWGKHSGMSKSGWWFSLKNGKEQFYRSSLELAFWKVLEEDLTVSRYIVEPFSIPYESEGKIRGYTPDVLILFRSGETELVEVKPRNLVDLPDVQAKIEAAMNYCLQNGITKFSVWSGKSDLVGVK